MGFSMELHMIGRILLAFILGAIIGWEREQHRSEAGIRTYASISVGACMFGLISLYALGAADTTRIAAQVVTGIGFLGGGVILRHGYTVRGLTTAAALWTNASVGLAVAFRFYTIAILTTIIMFILLLLPRLSWWKRFSAKKNIPPTSKD